MCCHRSFLLSSCCYFLVTFVAYMCFYLQYETKVSYIYTLLPFVWSHCWTVDISLNKVFIFSPSAFTNDFKHAMFFLLVMRLKFVKIMFIFLFAFKVIVFWVLTLSRFVYVWLWGCLVTFIPPPPPPPPTSHLQPAQENDNKTFHGMVQRLKTLPKSLKKQ